MHIRVFKNALPDMDFNFQYGLNYTSFRFTYNTKV